MEVEKKTKRTHIQVSTKDILQLKSKLRMNFEEILRVSLYESLRHDSMYAITPDQTAEFSIKVKIIVDKKGHSDINIITR